MANQILDNHRWPVRRHERFDPDRDRPSALSGFSANRRRQGFAWRWWCGVCQVVLMTLFVDLAASGIAFAAEEIWSIEQLNAQKEHWADWLDKPLKVEGRVSAVSKRQFRFVRCDLTFHVTEEQSRTVGNVRNVEVSGRMKKDKETGKLIFVADRVKVLPTDAEQFDSREARLKSANAEDWYELASWARTRGTFYGDDELLSRAKRAWLKGIHFERQSLPDGDAEARFDLADKLADSKLEEALRTELVHEGARLKWERAKNDARERTGFSEWLAKTYPVATRPLDAVPVELQRRYEAQPLETFRAADDATRDVLARLFFIQVESTRILALAKNDGSNASAIADALEERVPERVDLIRKYRDQSFEWRKTSVTSASRQEALRLAEELKSRDQADAARDLLRRWIHSREDRLRKDGPIGLMQLAEDYLQLVQDEHTAVKLLAEAHKLDPSFADSSERLKQLGYRLEQERWVKGEASDGLQTPGQASHGQLSIGMTSDEVLALLGTPTAKSRVFTSAGVHEVWSFGRRGAPRLLIQLQRSSAGNVPKVTRFLTEN